MTTGSFEKKRKDESTKKLIICHIVGFVFVTVFAGFAHELAEAFPNFITYIFLPANTSLGQQIKLMITPLLIVFTIEYFIVGRELKDFIPIHLTISAVMPILTLGLYQTHYAVAQRPLDVQGAQIVMSMALIISAFLASTFMITSDKDFRKLTIPALVSVLAIVILLGVFTFIPPHSFTFFDYRNETYGILFK